MGDRWYSLPEPVPDVFSDDKVLVVEIAGTIAQRHRHLTLEQALAGIMKRYWSDQLPLFGLWPAAGCHRDDDGNFRRTPVERTEHPIWGLDDREGRIVGECLRSDVPRATLLALVRRSRPDKVDAGFEADQAGFAAVARMDPRSAFGPRFETLAGLRTYTARIAAWCQEEGLAYPSGWNSGPEPAAGAVRIDPATNDADAADGADSETASNGTAAGWTLEAVRPGARANAFAPAPARSIQKHVGLKIQDVPIVARAEKLARDRGITAWAALREIPDKDFPGTGTPDSRRKRILRQMEKTTIG